MSTSTSISAKDLAALVERYDIANEKRLQIQRDLKPLVDECAGLKQRIFDHLSTNNLTSAGYAKAVFTLKEELEPTVENWSDLYDYIQKTGQFEFLYRRVNAAAVKERWLAEETVPGVSKFPVLKLSRKSR